MNFAFLQTFFFVFGHFLLLHKAVWHLADIFFKVLNIGEAAALKNAWRWKETRNNCCFCPSGSTDLAYSLPCDSCASLLCSDMDAVDAQQFPPICLNFTSVIVGLITGWFSKKTKTSGCDMFTCSYCSFLPPTHQSHDRCEVMEAQMLLETSAAVCINLFPLPWGDGWGQACLQPSNNQHSGGPNSPTAAVVYHSLFSAPACCITPRSRNTACRDTAPVEMCSCRAEMRLTGKMFPMWPSV